MGPNGSGKSTLGYVLSGREDYAVTAGSATFNGHRPASMEPEQRAAAGLFLAFQAPIELPGVNNANFLRTALNAHPPLAWRKRARRGAIPEAGARRDQAAGDAGRHAEAQRQCRLLGRRKEAQRSPADGHPAAALAILDETDSGLDIDALKIVADGVNALRGPDFSALVITHHQRLLDYLVPNRVHVLAAAASSAPVAPSWRRSWKKGYAGMIAEAA